MFVEEYNLSLNFKIKTQLIRILVICVPTEFAKFIQMHTLRKFYQPKCFDLLVNIILGEM